MHGPLFSLIAEPIIDGPAGTPLDIPFFSKVTLQNCGKSISAFGYSVSLMHIPESAVHLAAVAARVAKKKAAKKNAGKQGKPRSVGPNTSATISPSAADRPTPRSA